MTASAVAPTHDAPIGPDAGTSPGAPAVNQAVLCEAWQRARAAADPRGEALAQALCAVAREARAGGAPVTALLRALDRLAAADGGAAAGFARVRAWAGTEVIRAYFRDG